MAKKGVAKITGNTAPKVGELLTYQVAEWHSGTSESERNPANVSWQLYKESSNGNFEKINFTTKGNKGFTFKWSAINKTYKLVGYLYAPEMSTAIEIRPQAGERSIDKIGFLDSNGKQLSENPKYGQTVKVVIETINMLAETLYVSLWERDTMQDSGHDAGKNTKLWGEQEFLVDIDTGRAIFDIMLSPGWAVNSGKGLFEGDVHEFYLLVRGAGAQTKYSAQRNVNNEVDTTQTANGSTTQIPTSNNTPISTPTSPRPQPRPKDLNQEPIKIQNDSAANPPASDGGNQVTIIEEAKVEGLVDAYFAKPEYTIKTNMCTQSHPYTFNGKIANNKTSTQAEKEGVADAILKKISETLKTKKQYTTKEAIVGVLVEKEYGKDAADKQGQSVEIPTFKLDPEFKKISSAPLEDKVYLVATSYLLDGKEVKITIKEKDGIIMGSPDDTLPVLELTEKEMKQTEPLKEGQGNPKDTFTGTLNDVEIGKDEEGKPVTHEMVAIPIQLRPEKDEELAEWKEKLAKGKREGTHTYTARNSFTIDSSEQLQQIAKTVATRSNNDPKLKDNGLQVYEEDIIELLRPQRPEKYGEARYSEVKPIPTYKKVTEMLWLEVSCVGDRDTYDKEFLKQDGAYFEIGKICDCEARVRAFMRTIRVAEGTGEYNKGTKISRDPQLGYTTWFSGAGNNFSDLSTHPQTINCNSTKTLCSSASGAYQIMGWKFDELNGLLIKVHNNTYKTVVPHVYNDNLDLAKKYNAKGFSEVSQDRLCVIILDAIGAIDSLLNDNVEEALDKSKGTWVSLPGATAGQPTAKMQETLDYYKEFLDKELSGETNLHIEPGFLKDFGYESEDCKCDDNDENNDWHHPLDRMELRGWYSETQWSPGKSDFKGRTGGKHDGLDLYAPVGTPVYACFDGEVTYIADPTGYGHRTFLEGTYKGEKYFLMYCHLSEYKVGKFKAGKEIGKTGQTGNANGQAAKMAHLHFEVRKEKMSKPLFSPLTEITELGNDVNINPSKESQTGI